MLKNYLKVVLRTIRRQAGYSIINIAGLAIGMACCLVITLWVLYELSFDRFHANARNLYRVEENQSYAGRIYHVTVTPFPLAPALKDEIPEIAEATRLVRTGSILFRCKEKAFYEDGVAAVDPSFLRMFSFPLVKGDAAAVLADPSSVVLTETTAKKYFGDEDPLGKVLTVNNEFDLKVTGIARDVPLNSTIRFDMLFPYELLKSRGRTSEDFGTNSIWTYVELRPGASVAAVNDKIRGFIKQRVPQTVTELELFAYTRIHLHQHFGYDPAAVSVRYVYIFSLIAAFVLLIACINFMNLATARSAGRAKEVGLRKVVGALKRHLIVRFYSESITYAFLSLFVALLLVRIILPWFNALAGKELSLNLWANRQVLAGVAAITLLTGFLAGSYPAVFLSAFHPVRVLKGGLRAGAGSVLFRRILVIVQFALSVFLIIGTVVVYRQMQYMKTKSLGFDKEQVIFIPLRGNTAASYEALRSELRKDSRILGVTAASHLPSTINSNSSGVNWKGKDPNEEVLVGMSGVDYDYIDVLKIELVEGRNFSRELETDKTQAFLVNEEVRKLMGKPAAAGEEFSFAGRDGRIVGVMKNFHFETLQSRIEPLAIYLVGTSPNQGGRFSYLLARVSPTDVQGAVDFVRRAWTTVLPNYPSEVRFLDEQVDSMYRTEERAGRLLRTFAFLAIFIACLGLFGLASFMAEQRTREVGIRKVLGASVAQVAVLLCREFFLLVLLANLLAWPLAYLTLDKWLKNYAYRISLGPLAFFLALGAALVVAIATVSFQAVRAALANPTKALKYE
ncbi:MAG: ABC transporter permease [Candidatus Aminicenantes bacterium]|nr:ABC transporter permease [Candidatus Aminicenantes bacterium]